MSKQNASFVKSLLRSRSKLKYFDAIQIIADNDNPGGSDALDAESIEGYISVQVVADLWDVPAIVIAEHVVAYRKGEMLK